MGYRVVRVGSNEAAPVDDALRDGGFEVATAETVEACLEALDRVDCVVTTDSITDGTCLDLCSRVRGAHPVVPIIVYPKRGSEALAGDVIAAGADGYVPQAAGVETLFDRVTDVIGTTQETVEADPAETPPGTADERRSSNLKATVAETVIETIGECVYALDRERRITVVNDALINATGYNRDELLGEHVSTVLNDESAERNRVETDRLEATAPDSIATYRVALVTADGEHIPCESTTTLVDDYDGIARTVSTLRNVRECERMERELLDRKARIEGLHEIASRLDGCTRSEAVFELTVEAARSVLDFDACEVRWTDEGEEKRLVSGPDESILDVQTEAGNTETEAGDTETEAGDTELDAASRPVLRVPIGDHGVFRATSTESRAFDHDDRELAELLVSHVVDSLDRIQFETQLKSERDRFAVLFENVPDAVISVCHRGGDPIIEEVNSTFEQLFGYDGTALIGEPLDGYIVPANRRAEAQELNRRVHQGNTVEAEVTRRTSDGLREFIVRTVPIDETAPEPQLFSLYTDITEQKQRQKRLEILNRVLRHDLRNGMNIIGGCATLLADLADDERADRYASVIHERIEELVELAEKTRTVERTIERSAAPTVPMDLAEVVSVVLERLERRGADATIETSVPQGTVVAGTELLETALFHVLENAIEHNDTDEPYVHIEVTETDDELFAISVTDNGPGIPLEERELLQEEREITQLRHTSGLGLWLVNWVVTQSGGRLAFAESEPRGAVVTLELPKASGVSSRSVKGGAATTD